MPIEVLVTTRWGTLTKHVNPRSGRKHYCIQAHFIGIVKEPGAAVEARLAIIRYLRNGRGDIAKPYVPWSMTQKYTARKEAEQVMTGAMLLWGV